MFSAPESPYLVPFNGKFQIKNTSTEPQGNADKNELKKKLKKRIERFKALQRMFYADDRHALLLVFQAMDAAGKDSTIRAVTSGVNPAGFQVFSFKAPSNNELEHDFLWRTNLRMPERGRIGIFNRSYYEEVLVVRVHPEFLHSQRLPGAVQPDKLWSRRFRSINELERHMAHNGTVVLKFWLNVSRQEQKRRFMDRLNEPEKHWKFSANDVRERGFWDKYMHAYEQALRATSTAHAPWYAIPADNKPYMRFTVADIIVRALESLDLSYPTLSPQQHEKLDEMRTALAKT